MQIYFNVVHSSHALPSRDCLLQSYSASSMERWEYCLTSALTCTTFAFPLWSYTIVLLQVHTVIKRRWGQHKMMTRKSANPRSTYFTQTSMTEQPPLMGRRSSQSPRGSIFDSGHQQGDRKPSRSIFKPKGLKPWKNGVTAKPNGCHFTVAEKESVLEKAPMENSAI